MTVAGPVPMVRNLTPALNEYFWEGGIYGAVWNGTSWLIVGQAGWGGGNYGSAVALHGDTITNLTSRILPEFAGGGVFAVGRKCGLHGSWGATPVRGSPW